jgi:alkylation response protein AidB-like acyl-CoA dehydrogenase
VRFSFTDDQLAMRDAVRDLLVRECPPSRIRAAWDDGTGHASDVWQHITDMGMFDVHDPVDQVLLIEECGRAGVPGPVVEHAALGAPLGATGIATAHLDDSPYVAHAHVADSILTPIGWHRGFTATDVAGIDGGRRLFTIAGGEVEPFTFDVPTARNRGSLATAAFLVGVGDALLAMAGDYARGREQFGTPIGSFQAVKHLMADALLRVEFARPAVYRAAWSMSVGHRDVDRDVSMAKVFANEAAQQAARSAIQVHGAMGYTWECDAQLFAKKAWSLTRAYGSTSAHRRRVSASVL